MNDLRSSLDLLAAWIDGQVAYRPWPGLSIAIVHDRAIVWARGFGWADTTARTPATAETLYRVASITKTFTATAVMQLRDAGTLRLDDPVREHLPWFVPPSALTTNVTDLARFAMLQMGSGSAVLKDSTLREMHRVHWLEPDWQAGWGLGFHVLRLRGRTLVGHGGSLRGYRSEIRFCPDERMAVIVLINGDDGEPRAIVDKAFEWVAPAIAKASAPPPATPDPA